MRLVVVLSFMGCAALFVLSGLSSASDAEGLTQHGQASKAAGLILQQSEGELRVRRPRPGSNAPMAAPSLIIKVDGRNGGSPDFFVGYEEIPVGSAIPVHSHPDYDEVVLVHEGEGLASLGTQERVVTAGATIYIPPKMRVSLKNTGKEPLSLFFIFPRPEMVSEYYRGMTAGKGEPLVPFSPDEFAAFRARHRTHIEFEQR